MYPSIKSLQQIKDVTRQDAIAIRGIMARKVPIPCGGCGKTDAQICTYYHDGACRPSRMRAIDRILRTCGVEYIPKGHNRRSPAIYYCNTGDTYDTTIMKINGRFRVGCWGDIVERGNYD